MRCVLFVQAGLFKGYLSHYILIFMVVYTAGQEQLTSLAGTTTVIDCPIQSTFTYPDWSGPPNDMPYTQGGQPGFNPALPNKDRVSYRSNYRSLLITQTALTDAGTYRCSKVIDGKLLQEAVVLQVRKPPSSTLLSTNVGQIIDNKLIVTEDKSVTLACTSSGGYPSYTVNLYRNIASGTPMTGTSNTNTEDDRTVTVTKTYVMTVRRTDDRVNLICRSGFSTEPFGYQDTTVKLFPNLKPTSPTVSTVESPVSGDISQTIARCVTSGFRPSSSINMTMSFSGLTNAYTTAVEDINTETYSITAYYNRAVQKADNGQSLTCSVKHQTLPTPISQSVAIDVKFAPTSVSLTGNTSVVANGNNKLTLTCTAGSSNPATNITWTYNVNGITKQKQYKAGSYNGRVTSQQLELTPTRDDDGKTVMCSASNTVNINTPVTSETKTLILQYHPIATLSGPTLVTEGDENVVLNCSAHSRPFSTFTWYHNNTQLSVASTVNNVGIFRISRVSRTDDGMYKCRASNNISPASESTVEMSVQYAPDVTVTTQNVTINDSHVDILCSPSGVPASYTYQPWTQAWVSDGCTVPLPTQLGNSSTLRLTDLSYQHSGLYTCRASNGVTRSIHDNAGHGDVHLNVKSFPIITEPVVPTGQYHKGPIRIDVPTHIYVKYYNNGDAAIVNCYKVNNNSRQISTVHSISSTKHLGVQLPVYTQTINTKGAMTIVTFTIAKESQLGYYVIVIMNSIGESIVPVHLFPAGPPYAPEELSVDTSYQTHVTISWIQGFHGGYNQTFVIQLSLDNSTWWNKTSIFGGKDISIDHINATVDELLPGTQYFVRMFAYNQLGKGPSTVTMNFTTNASVHTEQSESSFGAVIGGVGGGIITIVLIVVVVLILNRKYQVEVICKCNCKCNFKKKKDISKDINTTASNESSSPYDDLTDRNTSSQPYDSLHGVEMQQTTNQYENLEI